MENTYSSYSHPVDVSESFPVLMRNVYTWMTWGILLTALTALYFAKNASLMLAVLSNPALMWGCLIAELILVIMLSARIMNMSFAAAAISFAAYAVLNGVTMSVIFAAYTQESIAQTFFITAGTFAGMSLVGYIIKKDLSTLGRALFMLLIGLIIATVVSFFFQSPKMVMILNYVGVIVFVGLTAYDTQKIKNMLEVCTQQGMGDQTRKLALMGSLTLYLDFVNLFLYLLRFLGNRK